MLSYNAINKAVDKGMVIVIITFILALAGSTPESSKYLTDGIRDFSMSFDIFGVSPVINIPPTIEMPVILQWIAVIWTLYLILTGYMSKFKSLSPQIFGEGLEHSLPYRGRASIKTEGKIVYVRGGGSSAPVMPYDGPVLISAPATHCYKIGEHFFTTAALLIDQPVSAIPFEAKDPTFSERSGFNPIESCAIGWLSKLELNAHPIYKKMMDNGKGKEEEQVLDTLTYILSMNKENEAIDRLFELMRYKVGTLQNDLSLISQLTNNSSFKETRSSIASRIFKTGSSE